MFRNFNLKKGLAIGIGVILGIVAIFLAFTVLQGVFTSAADLKPQDVVISSVTQNSAKITWTTQKETLSNVEYGTSPTSLTFSAPETEKSTSHSVDLTLLSKNTTYYFQIAVADDKFDNGGIPWTFTTKDDEAESTVPVDQTASPSAVPESITPLPPTVTPIPTGTCNYTNCADMKANFGKGCTTQDYFKCLKTSGTPTPTLTGTLTPTPTP